MSDDRKLGATGDYPEGKLTASDEGALQFAVGERDGNVIIDFGKPVAWIAMPPEQAAKFASALVRHAREVARQRGIVIELEL
jgi:hypothetical protein